MCIKSANCYNCRTNLNYWRSEIKNEFEEFFKNRTNKHFETEFALLWMGGVLRPRIIASRNLKIQALNGTVTVKNFQMGGVQIGFGYVGIIDNRYQRSVWENNGEIVFEGRARFGPGTRIINDGNLEFGDNFSINAASHVICYDEITFGRDVLISWNCLIMDTDFHKIISNKNKQQVNTDRPIVIGDHVWIACESTILKGSSIPSDSIIAAGSVICKRYTNTNTIYTSTGEIRNQITWTY